jgi:hypothetical protein
VAGGVEVDAPVRADHDNILDTDEAAVVSDDAGFDREAHARPQLRRVTFQQKGRLVDVLADRVAETVDNCGPWPASVMIERATSSSCSAVMRPSIICSMAADWAAITRSWIPRR